jgi:hypothetical protein
MAKVQRQHERSRSEQQLAIQIACGHGNWVHNGLTWPRTARRRNLLPTQPPARRSPQRPHPPARWSSPLTYPIAGRITQPPPAQPRITFQRDLASDASGRRHQRRCMTDPATRTVRPRSPAQILIRHDAERLVRHADIDGDANARRASARRASTLAWAPAARTAERAGPRTPLRSSTTVSQNVIVRSGLIASRRVVVRYGSERSKRELRTALPACCSWNQGQRESGWHRLTDTRACSPASASGLPAGSPWLAVRRSRAAARRASRSVDRRRSAPPRSRRRARWRPRCR